MEPTSLRFLLLLQKKKFNGFRGVTEMTVNSVEELLKRLPVNAHSKLSYV